MQLALWGAHMREREVTVYAYIERVACARVREWTLSHSPFVSSGYIDA